MITCWDCGKELTPETNEEDCPKTLSFHGKHSFFVVAAHSLDEAVEKFKEEALKHEKTTVRIQ